MHRSNRSDSYRLPPARIRQELGYQEAVAIEEAIRRTVCGERENPPAGVLLAQFDYAAEGAAVAGHHPSA